MNNSKVKGIALIQVLIITIILTTLGIFINQTVQKQVLIVSVMKDSNDLMLMVENSEEYILHALLTNPRYVNKDNENFVAKVWNFYGQPFKLISGVEVTIQDLSSLLSLNHFNSNMGHKLIEQLKLSNTDVDVFIDSLSDWKDKDNLTHLNGAERNHYKFVKKRGPRNGYLQNISEVMNVKNGEILTLSQWNTYFSAIFTSSFNPLNAPKEILKTLISDDRILNEVIKLRNDNKLSELTFFQKTNIDSSNNINFSTGRKLKVQLTASKNKNYIQKSFIVELRGNSIFMPITISQIKWNNM